MENWHLPLQPACGTLCLTPSRMGWALCAVKWACRERWPGVFPAAPLPPHTCRLVWVSRPGQKAAQQLGLTCSTWPLHCRATQRACSCSARRTQLSRRTRLCSTSWRTTALCERSTQRCTGDTTGIHELLKPLCHCSVMGLQPVPCTLLSLLLIDYTSAPGGDGHAAPVLRSGRTGVAGPPTSVRCLGES